MGLSLRAIGDDADDDVDGATKGVSRIAKRVVDVEPYFLENQPLERSASKSTAC